MLIMTLASSLMNVAASSLDEANFEPDSFSSLIPYRFLRFINQPSLAENVLLYNFLWGLCALHLSYIAPTGIQHFWCVKNHWWSAFSNLINSPVFIVNHFFAVFLCCAGLKIIWALFFFIVQIVDLDKPNLLEMYDKDFPLYSFFHAMKLVFFVFMLFFSINQLFSLNQPKLAAWKETKKS